MGFVRLEYYPIERAAKELGCDAGDILHWGSLGMVEGCVLLKRELVKASFKRNDKTNWHPDPEADTYSNPDEFFEINGYAWGAAGKYSRLSRDWEAMELYAEGPWAFSPFVFKDIVAGKSPRRLKDESFWPAGYDKARDELYMSVRIIDAGGAAIDTSQIYLVWDDVERIRASIETDMPLDVLPHFRPLHPRPESVADELAPVFTPKQVSDQPQAMANGRAEANKARHDEVRDRRIAAARKVQELRPEGCHDASSWARAVLDLEGQAFADGEPAGVNEARLAQVIRDAINARKLEYTKR